MTADAIPTLALSQATISPEVQGALTSVLRSSPDPRTRSSVICAVILEMCSIVEGLTISEPGHTRVAERRWPACVSWPEPPTITGSA